MIATEQTIVFPWINGNVNSEKTLEEVLTLVGKNAVLVWEEGFCAGVSVVDASDPEDGDWFETLVPDDVENLTELVQELGLKYNVDAYEREMFLAKFL
jgi:antitoxin component HigA of HigAB toxin-antitoxin module